MEIFPISINKGHDNPFTLYYNALMDKVKGGWIIFLDDVDTFNTSKTLHKLYNKIESREDMIFWDVHSAVDTISCRTHGGLVNCSYCFHSDYKHLSQWDAGGGGNCKFLTGLLQKNKF